MHIQAETTTLMWDLDGTIIDSLAVMEHVLSSVLPAYGREMPPHETMLLNVHGSMADIINNGLGGVEPDELEVIVKDYMIAQNKHYETVGHPVFPDALALMERAHDAGKKQVIVTNRNHEGMDLGSPRSIVKNTELSLYIGTVFCGDDSEHRKPKPEVLGNYLTDEGIVPQEIVVIGDQYIDAQLADYIGARAILVARCGKIPHLDRLTGNSRAQLSIVESLDDVKIHSAHETQPQKWHSLGGLAVSA